jgi:hypothetical protein
MEEVGKFVILDRQYRGELDTFESRRQFDDMFNETYDDIEHALLWTDTILENIVKNAKNAADLQLFPREKLLAHATDPVSLHEYRDRLASFPKNLKFVAKKMALYFYKNGVSLESISKIKGFNPIITVVIIAVLHLFLIETEYDAIFKRIYKRGEKVSPSPNQWGQTFADSPYFEVFFRLIDKLLNVPPGIGIPIYYRDRIVRIYEPIVKATRQLSTMMGLSGFLNNESPQLNQMSQQQRQELIALLQDASKKVRIYAKIEDGPEPPPSAQVMSLIGSLDTPKVVQEAADFEKIRAMQSRYYHRQGGKRRKSSNHTQRRKKNGKHSKKSRRRS